MSTARSEELRIIAEQAVEWLDQPATTPNEREEQLKWLMESPLHVREMLAAMEWDEEFRQLLDPDHRIDADELIAKALSCNVISVAERRPTSGAAAVVKTTLESPREEIEVVDLGDAISKDS